MRALSFLLIFFLLFQTCSFAIDDDMRAFADEQKEMLKRDAIDVQEFVGKPWYVRHKGKLIGFGLGAAGGLILFFTAGAGAPVSAMLTTTATSHFVGTAAAGATAGGFLSAAGGAAVVAGSTIAVGALFNDDGELVIPEAKRSAAMRFYDENWRSWAEKSQDREEFGALALKELVGFLAR